MLEKFGRPVQHALYRFSARCSDFVEVCAEHPLFVSFAGGGIYFFWQLGAVKYLQTKYDLTQVPMAGASSGSLVACLSACGIDPQLIVDEAYQLSLENDIWNRKFGLLGIWGNLIRDWLDKLLPDDAHELVSGRLHVIIAKAPTLELFEVRFCSHASLSPMMCLSGVDSVHSQAHPSWQEHDVCAHTWLQ